MDTKEARIYIAVIISVVLIGIIIFYFALSVIRQQKQSMQLQKANMLAMVAALEKERTRIAADLHDDIGPLLAVIRFKVDAVETLDKKDQQHLDNASRQLDSLIVRMREVANNLMPAALHRKGLAAAVKEFVSNAGTGNLKISFTSPDMLAMPEEKSTNIYRIIQEITHNCIKHAKATKLDISMESSEKGMKIVCRDNGNGFDYADKAKDTAGRGLQNIRDRTEMIGGRLLVESKPGKGTAFLFEIPV